MGALSPMDAKALQAHEVMKSCHDFDSIMTEGSLATIQAHYSVSDEYALHTSLPGQHPYSPYLHGFCVLVDALERSYAFLSTSLSRSDARGGGFRRVSMLVRKGDACYQALRMTNLPPQDLDSKMKARWGTLKNSSRSRVQARGLAPLKEDDLLKAVWELEAFSVELPRKTVKEYKETTSSGAMGVEPREWLTDQAIVMLRVPDLTSIGRHRYPPSSAKMIVNFCVVAEESVRLSFACVRKLVRVDWEKAGELGRDRLGLLGNTSRAPSSRDMPKDPAQRPRQGVVPDVELYRVRLDYAVLGLAPLCRFIFSNAKSNSSVPSGLSMWVFISNIKVHLLLLQILSADSIVNKEMQMSYDRGAVGVHYCSTMASLQSFLLRLQLAIKS
ncbi:hypothetical protein BHE74_00014046 [Ensete ventricosum]|nr:hypothetical protein BHE74_00014046 [Ensete ventricosum]